MGQPVPANISLADIRADEKDRDQREKLPDIVQALKLASGSFVADLGTGYGYYAVRFSPVVGTTGRVFAEEIDGPLIGKLRSRLEEERLSNVTLILGKPDDPRLPASTLDAVLIADVYHEIARPAAVLARVREALKPSGLLMIIEYLKPEMTNRSRKAQAKEHNIAPEFVEGDLKRTGFVIVERRDPFGRGYDDVPIYFILARR